MELTEKIMETVKRIWFRSAEQSKIEASLISSGKERKLFFSQASCGDGLLAEVGTDHLFSWVGHSLVDTA